MDSVPKLIEAFAHFEPLALAILFPGLTALVALWLVAKALTKR
jgi:hypothetical protein